MHGQKEGKLAWWHKKFALAVKNATLARQVQMRMGYPGVNDLVEGINKGRLLKLPITKSDLDNAELIWGKIWCP